MDFTRLTEIAERARTARALPREDVKFVREVLPEELAAFPRLKLPKTARHAAGFSISGAPVGTFTRCALLVAARKALGDRFGGSEFYERVEMDLAFGIMRSHFHRGFPKGTHCCVQCSLAVYTVLEARAIRYFDCRPLARDVRRLIEERQWRFATPANPGMIDWALGSRL